jgi:hypothetical protein
MAKYVVDDSLFLDFSDSPIIDDPDIEFSSDDLILINEALANALYNCNESLGVNILADDTAMHLKDVRKKIINLQTRVQDHLIEMGFEFSE